MIPWIASIEVEKKATTATHYWVIPLGLLYLLLLPFVLIAAPLVALVCLAARVNPARAFRIHMSMFRALRGTEVAIDNPHSTIRVRIP